jgi:flavin-dependent dehydrogenase
MGGGLSGLTLALQLRKALPEAGILVIERLAHPVPEAAYKVGESVSEIASRYLRDALGLGEHLTDQQLRKFALRFFFTHGDNRDIASRVEIGFSDHIPEAIVTHQLDRGRLENWLATEVARLGVEFCESCKVEEVAVDRAGHQLTLADGDAAGAVRVRWLVDAAGRPGILKRHLGLGQGLDHDCNAAWCRVDSRIAVDDWTVDEGWQARVARGRRWLSTNHLMGPGYWVWLIPLASGCTSIGLVADPNLHPFETFNNRERFLDWLVAHEPQCAEHLTGMEFMDFRVLKRYAHGCERVFSTDRWFITGEAGVFSDPLYSPGSDDIATSNTFITDLIARDYRGEDGVDALIEQANIYFLFVFANALKVWSQQYPLMGNAQIMATKARWDLTAYWGLIAPLSCHDKLVDWDFMGSYLPNLARFGLLNESLQAFLREWLLLDSAEYSHAFINDNLFDEAVRFARDLNRHVDDAALLENAEQNVNLMAGMAREIFNHALRRMPEAARLDLSERFGPAFELDAAETPADAVARKELSRIWLTPAPQPQVAGA